MAKSKIEDQLFVPEKIEWMLNGGVAEMEPGERQLLLVMAETKLQEGYKPTKLERQVIDLLRALADGDYDAQDITDKVKVMVQGGTKQDTAPLRLPPMFDRWRKRLGLGKKDE
ncbi:MAG: hypothetical protein JW934_04610 [Anaerolineae bacterium]|nr:hypothetical protein [Anaerolineae bacterium]